LLYPRTLDLKAVYKGEGSVIAVRVPFFEALFYGGLPPVNLSLSRQLFRDSPAQGLLSVGLGPQPSILAELVLPSAFDLTTQVHSRAPGDDEGGQESLALMRSASGFGFGSQYWHWVVGVDGAGPNTRLEWGLTFSELALQVRAGVGLGLRGASWLFTGMWSNDSSEIVTTLSVGGDGVQFKIEFVHSSF
jgi:hypothetical protein